MSDPAGAWARPLKPQTPITDSELLTKQVITGINYDPSLAIPDQGCALDAGIKLYPVIVEGSVKPSSQPMREALDRSRVRINHSNCVLKAFVSSLRWRRRILACAISASRNSSMTASRPCYLA